LNFLKTILVTHEATPALTKNVTPATKNVSQKWRTRCAASAYKQRGYGPMGSEVQARWAKPGDIKCQHPGHTTAAGASDNKRQTLTGQRVRGIVGRWPGVRHGGCWPRRLGRALCYSPKTCTGHRASRQLASNNGDT